MWPSATGSGRKEDDQTDTHNKKWGPQFDFRVIFAYSPNFYESVLIAKIEGDSLHERQLGFGKYTASISVANFHSRNFQKAHRIQHLFVKWHLKLSTPTGVVL